MAKTLMYALACVLVPTLWGLVVVGITNWIERRVKPSAEPHEPLAQDDQV